MFLAALSSDRFAARGNAIPAVSNLAGDLTGGAKLGGHFAAKAGEAPWPEPLDRALRSDILDSQTTAHPSPCWTKPFVIFIRGTVHLRKYWHPNRGDLSTRVLLLPGAVCSILNDVRKYRPRAA